MRGELVTLQRTEQLLRGQYLGAVRSADREKLEALVEETERKRLANVRV